MRLTLKETHKTIHISYSLDGDYNSYEINLDCIEESCPQILYAWLLISTKKVLDKLPFDKIEFDVQKSLCINYDGVIRTYASELMGTNDFLQNNSNLKDIAKKWKNPLFIRIRDHRYEAFYNWLKDEIPSIDYLYQEIDFDPVTREWGEERETIKPHQLTKRICDHKIGSILTINSFFLMYFAGASNINMCALLTFMGVDMVMINNDPAELTLYGIYVRGQYHQKIRFSTMSILGRKWDDQFKQPVSYITSPHDYRLNHQPQIQEDYKVIVISNSRWEGVQAWKEPIKILLENMENPLSELPLWYMATHKLLENSDLTCVNKGRLMTSIHTLFYNAAQWMKYKIIENIKTSRVIEVYGDVGWRNICDKYYKGCLTAEQVDEAYENNNVLILLLNFGFTYLDHSGPMYDMIAKKTYWINVPPIVKTKELSGLENIEYTSYDRLNILIDDVRPYMKKSMESIDKLHSLYHSNTSNLVNQIKRRAWNCQDDDEFENSLVEHRMDMNSLLDSYIDKNEPCLRILAEQVCKFLERGKAFSF
ncbi:hypothetical protein [Prochlorococcus marinus]|nr:hypothetical protein [Prochlorococcus marinus]